MVTQVWPPLSVIWARVYKDWREEAAPIVHVALLPGGRAQGWAAAIPSKPEGSSHHMYMVRWVPHSVHLTAFKATEAFHAGEPDGCGSVSDRSMTGRMMDGTTAERSCPDRVSGSVQRVMPRSIVMMRGS